MRSTRATRRPAVACPSMRSRSSTTSGSPWRGGLVCSPDPVAGEACEVAPRSARFVADGHSRLRRCWSSVPLAMGFAAARRGFLGQRQLSLVRSAAECPVPSLPVKLGRGLRRGPLRAAGLPSRLIRARRVQAGRRHGRTWPPTPRRWARGRVHEDRWVGPRFRQGNRRRRHGLPARVRQHPVGRCALRACRDARSARSATPTACRPCCRCLRRGCRMPPLRGSASDHRCG